MSHAPAASHAGHNHGSGHGHDHGSEHGHSSIGHVIDHDFGAATNGKIAMWIFLVTDGLTFAGLLLGYGYLRMRNPQWPNPQELLGITLTGAATFLLICSSLSMVLSLAAAAEKKKSSMLMWLFLTALGGAGFLGIQYYEYSHLVHEGVTISGLAKPEHLEGAWRFAGIPENFASTFYIVTGFHGLHVTTGVIYLLVLLIKGMKQREITPEFYNVLEIGGLFWHFVDLVWILVFTFIYLV